MHLRRVDYSCFGHLNCQNLYLATRLAYYQDPPPRPRDSLRLLHRVRRSSPPAVIFSAHLICGDWRLPDPSGYHRLLFTPSAPPLARISRGLFGWLLLNCPGHRWACSAFFILYVVPGDFLLCPSFDDYCYRSRSRIRSLPPDTHTRPLQLSIRHEENIHRIGLSAFLPPLLQFLSRPDRLHLLCASTPRRNTPLPSAQSCGQEAPVAVVLLSTIQSLSASHSLGFGSKTSTMEIRPNRRLLRARPRIQEYTRSGVQGLVRNMG
ncbi:hypothetical protein C8F04DRAFT_1105148 [Mycena alexandri]|uniref:Uncharacterized protein n=1 Tax=Mycena alexandri TaxID=1745969 RepID=A0AAD6SUV6_9AGAR|nr:hypothetical protein C8F04DRAFT_1105148 [Mycena alexandri]